MVEAIKKTKDVDVRVELIKLVKTEYRKEAMEIIEDFGQIFFKV